jgi:hypothetical protein
VGQRSEVYINHIQFSNELCLVGVFQFWGELSGTTAKLPPRSAKCLFRGSLWLILEAVWAVCPQVEVHPRALDPAVAGLGVVFLRQPPALTIVKQTSDLALHALALVLGLVGLER